MDTGNHLKNAPYIVKSKRIENNEKLWVRFGKKNKLKQNVGGEEESVQ
jgi:hypothetical protein